MHCSTGGELAGAVVNDGALPYNSGQRRTMHITGMDIKETPPFTELVELDFDERVNVFIGPNASGKSTLLREIDVAFNKDIRPDSRYPWHWREKRITEPFVFEGESRREYGASEWSAENNVLVFTNEDWAYQTSIKKPPVVYVGPVRTGLPELYEEEAISKDDAEVGEVLRRPFSGANFKAANEKMHEKATTMLGQEKEDDVPLDERRAFRIFEGNETVYLCVRAICEEVLTGEYTRNYETGFSEEFLDSQPFANFDEVTIHRSLGVTTTDRPNFDNVRPEDRPTYSEERGQAPLYAGFLSSGTQATFLWIYWLAYKMLYHYEFAGGWKDEPAILLIDEIENHLHPTWQRRVIPALLEHFPGLQIFATTHSPFVVAGLRAGQVHLLDRDADGVVTASTNEQDIIGWTTDEILRTFMGVDEPTDELTIQRTKRLRELRGKESLSDDEREELEKLRQKVNEDLLSSSSPLELQRERYGDMMLQFLESRQSELSQDGG